MHWTLSTSQPMLPPTSSQEHACTTASSKGNILETAAKISRGLEQDSIPDKPVKFSQQLIAFTLYGKQREMGSLWSPGNVVMLSSRVLEVRKHFPDIPNVFSFGLSTVQFGAVGVFCNQLLQKGSILGPFTGRKLSIEEARKKHRGTYWEIHIESGIKYCLDGSDPAYRNWMYFIQYARGRNEQNLIAAQYNENLYFKAERDIQPGEELLVWYDQLQYNLYMGIPRGFVYLNPEDKLKIRHEEITAENDEEILDDIEEEDEEIEIEKIDDNSFNEVVDTSLTNSEKETGSECSSRSGSSTNLYSPVYPSLVPSSSLGGHSVPGFTTVYPLSPLQLPWIKRQPIHTPTLPITWPIIGPSTASSVHVHKLSNVDMFIRGVDSNRWQCQLCQKIFTSQGSLRAHARIHTGERPYQCKFCKRTFTQASTLRSHERLHTGERPYICKHCGKAFTQSAGLRSHLKTHMKK